MNTPSKPRNLFFLKPIYTFKMTDIKKDYTTIEELEARLLDVEEALDEEADIWNEIRELQIQVQFLSKELEEQKKCR
jgi:hypothetical protein